MKEFFGFGGFEREPEGWLSPAHLILATSFVLVMIGLAIFLGLRYRNKSYKEKNKIIIWSALLIDGFEIFKIIMGCITSGDPLNFLNNLPLFLCSIQLITLPVAAFSKGRLKDASLDFVFIFGMLGALAGIYGAAQNYNAYPTLSFPNVVSAITHSISGFASLYIVISGVANMKIKNTWISLSILGTFGVLAYIANLALGTNYMFLMSHDGTPYSIFYNLVNGNRVAYPILVILTLVIWICIYYGIFYYIKKRKATKNIIEGKS